MSESTSDAMPSTDTEKQAAALAYRDNEIMPDTAASKSDIRVRKVELVVRCQELSRFLRGFDELNWAGWLEDCVTLIRQDGAAGSERLLRGYSGIGSFSDVYLCPEAGHRINISDESAINEQFLLMLSKVNNLAREILSRR